VKVLLDECVPWRLAAAITGHLVRTVPQAGWAGIENGRLLRLAETEFEVLVTVDQNLRYQQNLTLNTLAVIILCAKGNRYEDLVPLVPQLNRALEEIRPKDVVVIGEL